MKLVKLTLGDIHFQLKYGFYLLYTVFTIIYICLLFSVPDSIRNIVGTILIFSDPAAMGLFFMGAIVLLEKSQRVHCSLAISPIKVWEYIIAKVLSLAAIGSVVGYILIIPSGIDDYMISMVGIVLASIIFSLCGLFIAMKIDTLNQFIIAIIPFEIFICVPPALLLFGIDHPLLLLHPGIAAVKLIYGEHVVALQCIGVLILWSIMAFVICHKAVAKSFQEVGGGKI